MLASAADSANVTPDQAEKLLKEKKDIVVLDVRTPEEFKEGHIAGAKNVDFQSEDFKKQVAALDKSKTYLLHCAAGGRSARALKVLDEDKFSHVYHLNGGFSAWKEAGKPVAK
jgi:rhodanese-related sulfurtransferase